MYKLVNDRDPVFEVFLSMFYDSSNITFAGWLEDNGYRYQVVKDAYYVESVYVEELEYAKLMMLS